MTKYRENNQCFCATGQAIFWEHSTDRNVQKPKETPLKGITLSVSFFHKTQFLQYNNFPEKRACSDNGPAHYRSKCTQKRPPRPDSCHLGGAELHGKVRNRDRQTRSSIRMFSGKFKHRHLRTPYPSMWENYSHPGANLGGDLVGLGGAARPGGRSPPRRH